MNLTNWYPYGIQTIDYYQHIVPNGTGIVIQHIVPNGTGIVINTE
jgi:hypothetical protein